MNTKNHKSLRAIRVPSTQQRVADLAGVSRSTVSRVMSGAGDGVISEETRSRVYQAAEELGYSPNPIARALRGKPTGLIGLIVREVTDPLLARFIEELSGLTRDRGYNLVLGHAGSDANRALELGKVLDARHCDGVIVVGDLRNDATALDSLRERNPNVLSLFYNHGSERLPSVNCDNASGMKQLLDHLIDLGHRHIGFIEGGWFSDTGARWDAFARYARTKQLPAPPVHVQTTSSTPEDGYQALLRLMAHSPRPTAVVASDDMTAFGALKAAADQGLRVPADVCVTGYDDIEMSRYVVPSLTTVRQPVEAMCQRAVELLTQLIDGNSMSERDATSWFEPTLVVRASTGPNLWRLEDA